MKYPEADPFVRKQVHPLALSVCAAAKLEKMENSKVATRGVGRAIVEVVNMFG